MDLHVDIFELLTQDWEEKMKAIFQTDSWISRYGIFADLAVHLLFSKSSELVARDV